jgi:hypothetical protein
MRLNPLLLSHLIAAFAAVSLVAVYLLALVMAFEIEALLRYRALLAWVGLVAGIAFVLTAWTTGRIHRL